ncbi:MAG: PQQ-binding-like beta-propeller repeat protein, partial [Caulobacteraceae bacterium]
ILGVLRNGVMRSQAEGLSLIQMVDLAAYLSKGGAGPVSRTSAETPTCAGPAPPMTLEGPRWNGWGADVRNDRLQPDPGLVAAEVPRLKLAWAIALNGDRAGEPIIAGDRLFINDASGTIEALDARTGCLYWRYEAQGASRATMSIGSLPRAFGHDRYALYFVDSTRQAYALDAQTGALLWKTSVDDQKPSLMTGSPALFGGRLYIPISSGEEVFSLFPGYLCCRFRGAVVALDAFTGKLVWKTYTVPGPAQPLGVNAKGKPLWGPAGGAIWSAPTIDARRGLLYVGTGNSYTNLLQGDFDSVLAIDLKSGTVRWKRSLDPTDTYLDGCNPPAQQNANCPKSLGGDFDIGASPILHRLPNGRRILVVGQKSGQVWGLDPDHAGKVLWVTRLSKGGPLGGVEFGPAIDGERVFAAVSDIFTGAAAKPGLSALDLDDGELVWSDPATRLPCAWSGPFCDPALSQAVTAMPGVVFAGSMDGWLRAWRASDGKVLWSYDTGGAPIPTLDGGTARGGVLDGGGPTIAGGRLYVVSGYAERSGRPGTVLLAFSVDGRGSKRY